VESHLERVIEHQEKKLGIKHFGMPKVSFRQLPWLEHFLLYQTAGQYNPNEDEILLSLGVTITPEKNLPNILATALSFGSVPAVEDALYHELGHFYTDKLHESLGRGNWPDYTDKQKADDYVGLRLISEGIAEYFRKTMNDEQDNFDDSDWPEELEDLGATEIYKGGFHLVKPIIDKYGKRGIEYLTDNPPNTKDLANLPAYQHRILRSLASQSRKQKPVNN
jgi:hypothetical protein